MHSLWTADYLCKMRSEPSITALGECMAYTCTLKAECMDRNVQIGIMAV